MLRIAGPERGLYWRATTLDQFEADRWLENPTPLSTGPARGPLPSDPLLPSARARPPRAGAAGRRGRGTGATTTSSRPRSRSARRAAARQRLFRLSDGIVRVFGGLQRGQRYTVWSYAPRPEPGRARPGRRPTIRPALDRFLDIGRTRVEPFGTPGRDARVDALFDDERYLALWPYEAMWNEAPRLRAGAETPYGAVVAIETWLRSTGGFAYDESPPPTGGLPPLAHFVAEGKRGYCQHFAGAMALMLRFLGIPARVAAGFTSGTREDGGWTVTDHNAHAWVEAWFPGYGWLPFDPTPGRGSLAASYSASSTGFNAGRRRRGVRRRAAGRGERRRPRPAASARAEGAARRPAAAGRAAAEDDGPPARSGCSCSLVLAAVGAIGAAKLVRRRLRYLTRDPRRLARRRGELADFLADQGVQIEPERDPRRAARARLRRAPRRRPPVRGGARPGAVRAARARRPRRRRRPAGSCARSCA